MIGERHPEMAATILRALDENSVSHSIEAINICTGRLEDAGFSGEVQAPDVVDEEGRDGLWPVHFWPIHFWPSWFWPGQFWPKPTLANPISANKILANPFFHPIFLVSWWGPKGGGPNPEKVRPRSCGPRRVGPRRVGPRRVEPRRVGAQNFALFFPSPAIVFLFFHLFWSFSWDFGGV